MKNRTLKDLYFGNIRPVERQVIHGSKLAKVSHKIVDMETQLQKILCPEALGLLEKLMKAEITRNAITAEENYVDGFKTGARFAMEILDDYYDNQEPLSD